MNRLSSGLDAHQAPRSCIHLDGNHRPFAWPPVAVPPFIASGALDFAGRLGLFSLTAWLLESQETRAVTSAIRDPVGRSAAAVGKRWVAHYSLQPSVVLLTGRFGGAWPVLKPSAVFTLLFVPRRLRPILGF
jgi:hypothetical protein